MNVLFIEKRLRTDKLGMLYLSAVMKNAGHNVDLIQDDIDNAEQYLQKHKIDFVMYSVMTSESLWYFKRNRELKKQFKFISVFGGPHFTFYPEQGVDDPDIDFIVRGPGENVILDVVEGRNKDKVIIGKIPDLNSVPHPDRKILYKYDYFGKAGIKRFMACRDCYHSCKFCSSKMYREIFKDQKCMFHQHISVDKLIEEIKDVIKEYTLTLVYFNDDDLACNHKWLKEFCKKYKDEINLPYGCEIRASSVNYDIIDMMFHSGCILVFIGLESSNKETLKKLGRTVTPEQVENVCNWCKKFNMRVSIENMIGLPVENPLADALETLEFNKKIPQTHSWVAIYQPFPNTELWQYCIDNGYLEKEKYTHFPVFEDKTKLNISDKDKISRLQKWWYYIVKYQIPSEVINILIEIPLSDDIEKSLADFRLKMASKELYTI